MSISQKGIYTIPPNRADCLLTLVAAMNYY